MVNTIKTYAAPLRPAADPLGEHLADVAKHLQELHSKRSKAATKPVVRAIVRDATLALNQLRQMAPRSPQYPKAWQQLLTIFTSARQVAELKRPLSGPDKELRAFEIETLNAAKSWFPSNAGIHANPELAAHMLTVLSRCAPDREFRTHARQWLATLKNETSLSGVQQAPAPGQGFAPWVVPAGVMPAGVMLQPPAPGAPFPAFVPPLPPPVDYNPFVLMHVNNLPQLSPAQVLQAAKDALYNAQSILSRAFNPKTPEYCLPLSVHEVQTALEQAMRCIQRTEPLSRASANGLWSSYRSLVKTAFDTSPTVFDEVMSNACDPVDLHDTVLLANLEESFMLSSFADLAALRREAYAVHKYGTTDKTQDRAKKLLDSINAAYPLPPSATKQAWTRDEIGTFELPPGMEKIVELQSLSGRRYYTTETLERGTFGKYRIAVDQDGKRWGIKVLRLRDGVADTLRAAKMNKKGYMEVPTAATSRRAAGEELQSMRQGSKNLQVEDTIEIDGKLYAVITPMEDELDAIRRRIPERDKKIAVVKYAFAQLAEELNVLHNERGRIHGDIKSLNALVNGDGVVAASDFGSSKPILDAFFRPFTHATGTYPPPGFEKGWGADADVWALGTLVVNMLKKTDADPFFYANFRGKNIASYERWYAAIPRDADGNVVVALLPQNTPEEQAWTNLFAGLRDDAPHLCKVVLSVVLNPDPELRLTAHNLSIFLKASDDADSVAQVAREALKEMAEGGPKEAKYQALTTFAEEQNMMREFFEV